MSATTTATIILSTKPFQGSSRRKSIDTAQKTIVAIEPILKNGISISSGSPNSSDKNTDSHGPKHIAPVIPEQYMMPNNMYRKIVIPYFLAS